jgi:hypothetical protein
VAKRRVGKHIVDVSLDSLDVATVRAKTPVKTGRLRDGWHIDADGQVSNEVEYATEIEFGTVSRPGAFMAERSVPEIAQRLAKRIAEQIDRPGLIVLPEIKLGIR